MIRRRAQTVCLILAAALVAAALAGCGLGPGKGTDNAEVNVTENFGSAQIGQHSEAKVPGAETVMRLTQRYFKVSTRYAGGYVQSIDGHSGTGNHRDWFYYENGVQATVGAAGTNVHKGDRIWWDLHDWAATQNIPAVVGSFPEPFVHGYNGTRYPTVLECANDVQQACNELAKQLKSDGVPVADQGIGTGSGSDSLTIVVATWKDLRGTIAGDIIDHGPKHSGIYGQFTNQGKTLQLDDPGGHVVRSLTAGAGLVAATRDQVSQPEWLVTGTDVAGVLVAAAAVNPQTLHNKFALAVQGSQRLPIPLDPSS